MAFLAQDIHKVAVGHQLWLQSLRLDWDWCTHCPLPRGLKSVPPPRGLSAARVLRAEQLVSLRLSNVREHPRNCHALLNLDLTYPPTAIPAILLWPHRPALVQCGKGTMQGCESGGKDHGGPAGRLVTTPKNRPAVVSHLLWLSEERAFL